MIFQVFRKNGWESVVLRVIDTSPEYTAISRDSHDFQRGEIQLAVQL